jgi:hypothetical protein
MPERIITDQLGSYKAAWNELPALEAVKHVFVKSAARLNNRIERDHEHVRERPKPAKYCCQGQVEATRVSRLAIPTRAARGSIPQQPGEDTNLEVLAINTYHFAIAC